MLVFKGHIYNANKINRWKCRAKVSHCLGLRISLLIIKTN